MLEFEKPIFELKEKIDELKDMARESELDLEQDIQQLESRLINLESDIYQHLSAWDRVQIARHPDRPTTLDYIDYLFTDFIELHGDRLFRDDPAMITGIAKYKDQPITVIGHQRGKNTKENIHRNFASAHPDRKSTRLNSSHVAISYAVFCLKKKK